MKREVLGLLMSALRWVHGGVILAAVSLGWAEFTPAERLMLTAVAVMLATPAPRGPIEP